MSRSLESEVRLNLKAMACDLQSPNPFKSLDEKLAIIERYTQDIIGVLGILYGGECKVVASSTDGLTTDEPKKWFELSCGHSFMLYGLGAPICCPVCGRIVKR